MAASPRNRTKPSDDVPNNVVILVDDDEDDVPAPEPTRLVHPAQIPPVTGGDSSGAGAGMNRQLYLWHQIAAHMRRERMLAEQIRAAAAAGMPALMTSPQYHTNNNIDPMIQFQAEVLQKQYLLYAHFYHNRSGYIDSNNNNNINRTGNRPVLGVNPGSRVIRKPTSGVSAAARLQYGCMHMHGGGPMARPETPFVAAPARDRFMNDSSQIGLGLGLGIGGGEIEPEGIDLTLKL